MGFADHYLSKHLFLLPQIMKPLPLAGLFSFIVVIPAYLEEDLLKTLICLKNAKNPVGPVLILIVINYPESDTPGNKEINHRLFLETEKWCEENSMPGKIFQVFEAKDLPRKHAGAGLARKIGMDWALSIYNTTDQPEGIILSLDADTTVDENYFTAIKEGFGESNSAGGCIIRFEHPAEGTEFSDGVYAAAICYELHLRYFKNMLALTGFPSAYYTIGSCFGVKAAVYARSGGMNRRKGGEDFYFLHKIFPHEPFINIQSTCVHPSPRPSLRVPFGTGPVIDQLVRSGTDTLLTYNPESFQDLSQLFRQIDMLYHSGNEDVLSSFSPVIRTFLLKNDFLGKIGEIRRNTASLSSFRKRFFIWFDGLTVVKFLNYAHKDYYLRVNVTEAAIELLKRLNMMSERKDKRNLLNILRERDSME